MRINMLPVINRPFTYVNTLGVGKLKWTGRVLQVLRISKVFAIMPESILEDVSEMGSQYGLYIPLMTKDE